MNNFEIVMEVISLEESGYHLADNQRDLTLIQKIFLFKAWPVYNNEVKREQAQQQDTTSTSPRPSPKVDPGWGKRQQEKRKQYMEK